MRLPHLPVQLLVPIHRKEVGEEVVEGEEEEEEEVEVVVEGVVGHLGRLEPLHLPWLETPPLGHPSTRPSALLQMQVLPLGHLQPCMRPLSLPLRIWLGGLP